MPEIDRLIRRAAMRLMMVRLVRAAMVSLGVGVGLLLAVRIGERLFSYSVDWPVAWAGVLGINLLGAIAWVIATRADRLGVAREVDERADLRESIGTALCVMGRDDGWSRATVEHARGLCRRVVVRQLFPVRLHRSWPVPIVGAGLFLLLGLVPRADLLSLLETAEAKQETRAEIESAQAQVRAVDDTVRDALKDLGVEFDDEAGADDEALGATSPEELRRAKIKELTTLSDKLSELENSEKMAGMDELKDRMAQLKQPDAGPSELDDMVKALQRGDFEDAAKALEALAKKMAQGDMSDAQKRALAEQMKKLGEQMAQLAQQQDALEKQLEKMGLDKALASDPAALQQALQNSPNLTQAQRDQLMKACQACNSASKACQGMAAACQKMGASLAAGQSGMEGMEQMAGQLSAAEMLQQEMNSLKSAQAIIKGQCQGLCNGMGQMDMMDIYKKWTTQGGGAGNRGTGGGKAPDPLQADFQLNPDRVNTTFDPDTPIIGSTLVRGVQVRGEAAQEFREAVAASSHAASEAIETKVIPREYHEAIKHYFGGLEQESEKAGADGADEPVSEPEEPAASNG